MIQIESRRDVILVAKTIEKTKNPVRDDTNGGQISFDGNARPLRTSMSS